MNSKNRYIALFLQVLFLAPLVYQNVHVFNHHFQTVCAHLEKDDNVENHSYKKHVGNDDTCIICNYEFSFFTSPEAFIFSTHILPGTINTTEVVLKGYPDIFNRKKSPRAPPLNA